MPSTGLTVAVTGPTGDLGLSIVDALERSRVGLALRIARGPAHAVEDAPTAVDLVADQLRVLAHVRVAAASHLVRGDRDGAEG